MLERERRSNVFNPENIQEGDLVSLKSREGESVLAKNKFMRVLSVRGKNNNKVYCAEIGHELYAQCFNLIAKSGLNSVGAAFDKAKGNQ
jgi:hypothetical protein